MVEGKSDFPALVEPNNPELVTINGRRVKEILEMMLGRTGTVRDRVITVGDLLDLGMLNANQARLIDTKRR